MKLVKRLYRKLRSEFIWKIKGGAAYARSIGVTVGSNCRIFTRRFGTEPFLIEIGSNVTITKDVIILTHDGSTGLFNDSLGRRFIYKKVKIGSNVFVGVNAIIMPGILIEDNVIVGAGSVVTKSVPAGSVVVGNPAKIIGTYQEYESIILKDCISKADFKNTLSRKENILAFADKAGFKPML